MAQLPQAPIAALTTSSRQEIFGMSKFFHYSCVHDHDRLVHTNQHGAAIIAAIYAMLAYHRPGGQAEDKQNTSATTLSRNQSIIPITLALVAWGAVAFNFVDRHYLSVPQSDEDYIQEYGVKGVQNEISYIMKVNTKPLLQYSEAYKLAFVVRVPYADRDRVTDTVIEKSGLYTITDSVVILAHPSSKTLRFIINQANPIEYTLILVPSKITVEQILSLGDVEHIGGRILATRMVIFPVGSPLATAPSQSK